MIIFFKILMAIFNLLSMLRNFIPKRKRIEDKPVTRAEIEKDLEDGTF